MTKPTVLTDAEREKLHELLSSPDFRGKRFQQLRARAYVTQYVESILAARGLNVAVALEQAAQKADEIICGNSNQISATGWAIRALIPESSRSALAAHDERVKAEARVEEAEWWHKNGTGVIHADDIQGYNTRLAVLTAERDSLAGKA